MSLVVGVDMVRLSSRALDEDRKIGQIAINKSDQNGDSEKSKQGA